MIAAELLNKARQIHVISHDGLTLPRITEITSHVSAVRDYLEPEVQTGEQVLQFLRLRFPPRDLGPKRLDPVITISEVSCSERMKFSGPFQSGRVSTVIPTVMFARGDANPFNATDAGRTTANSRREILMLVTRFCSSIGQR